MVRLLAFSVILSGCNSAPGVDEPVEKLSETDQETQIADERGQATDVVPSDASIDYRTNGTIRRIEADDLSARLKDDSSYAAYLQERNFGALALYLLDRFGTLLKLRDPATELILAQDKTDSLGYRQVRFRQVFNGLPIIGAEIIVHFNTSDAPYLIHGNYLATPIGFDTSPTLTGDEVLQSVTSTFSNARVGDLGGPAIWADAEGRPNLIFLIPVKQSIMEEFTLLVDAHDGAVLEKLAATYSQGL
jgi:Zn-dependent metalloprotease